jgi:hypothetical protein
MCRVEGVAQGRALADEPVKSAARRFGSPKYLLTDQTHLTIDDLERRFESALAHYV